MLDEAIGAARLSSKEGTAGARDAAALARLRAGVAMRIEAASSRPRSRRLLDWLASSISAETFGSNTRWVGVAACGAVVVVAGLITGLLYEPPKTSANVLAMLQPEPNQIFSGSVQ